MAFTDYENLFDSVDTAIAFEAFKVQVIEETCIRLLEGISKRRTDRIILIRKSEKSPVRKGVKQGDTTTSLKLLTTCPGEWGVVKRGRTQDG